MKKLYLGVALMYLGILTSHAQAPKASVPTDSTAYQLRKVKVDEINFVSAYYHQNGNHSAVTGGNGTENLTDFANTIDLQLSNYSKGGRKNTYLFELGVDHYTSASSDKIDPATISSASMQDTRIYPSLNWTSLNEKTGNAFGFTGSYSHEFDYQSFGGGFNLTRAFNNKNTQFDFKLQAFLDRWQVILPIELRPPPYNISTGNGRGDNRGPETFAPRNSFSAAFSISQVIDTRLQVLVMAEPSYQHGLLATKYQRDYFTDGSERAENLPGSRYKLPIAARFNYFLDDQFIIRAYYRYYMDNWGIKAHTAELEIPVKLSPFVSVSPFYRYNTQIGTRYFTPYGQHLATDTYYTSDYDLSTLHSSFMGAGIHITPPHGLFGIQSLNTLEIRYGHYIRSTDLSSNIVTLNLKFK
jgi:hypothetical protein